MFIRRATSRKMADGTCYATYRLVASERVDGKVRQRTLLNLGAHFALERDQWSLLCTRIEQLLAGEQQLLALDELPEAVEAEAQRIVAQLLLEQPALSPDTAEAATDMQTVDVKAGTGKRHVPKYRMSCYRMRYKQSRLTSASTTSIAALYFRAVAPQEGDDGRPG